MLKDQLLTQGIQPGFGRIRIMLPAGWGPDDTTSPAGEIHPSRPFGERDATYLTHTKSGSVVFATTPLSCWQLPREVTDGWQIDIDVDKLLRGQRVILNIYNLQIPDLRTMTRRFRRRSQHKQIHGSNYNNGSGTQLRVFANRYDNLTAETTRDGADPHPREQQFARAKQRSPLMLLP